MLLENELVIYIIWSNQSLFDSVIKSDEFQKRQAAFKVAFQVLSTPENSGVYAGIFRPANITANPDGPLTGRLGSWFVRYFKRVDFDAGTQMAVTLFDIIIDVGVPAKIFCQCYSEVLGAIFQG